jgi:hypothetical protein
MSLGSEKNSDRHSPSKEEEGTATQSDSPTNENSVPFVSEETEKRILTKLDRRIIPCVCWIYLMNFMDRGKSNDKCLLTTTADIDISRNWQCSSLWPRGGAQSECEPIPTRCVNPLRHLLCKSQLPGSMPIANR